MFLPMCIDHPPERGPHIRPERPDVTLEEHLARGALAALLALVAYTLTRVSRETITLVFQRRVACFRGVASKQ